MTKVLHKGGPGAQEDEATGECGLPWTLWEWGAGARQTIELVTTAFPPFLKFCAVPLAYHTNSIIELTDARVHSARWEALVLPPRIERVINIRQQLQSIAHTQQQEA